MSDLNLVKSKVNYNAVWILAKRELMEFWRNKSRVISSLAQGILFLFVFGIGFSFSSANIVIGGIIINSKAFAASGIAAMVILFTGIFGGMSVFRDKMFGFMKELMVAPVSRRTIMLGRTTGVALQTMLQVVIMIGLGVIFGYFGYDLSLIWRTILILPVAFLASLGIVGIGLTISTRLRDMQSFGLIQTFIIMPMMWLSGTLIPFPALILMFNPFSYSVDLFRFVLLGVSYFPFWADIIITVGFGTILILIGARSFNKMEISQ
ncbi:MAG: ABC transporter permease [Candidatus Thorarchaeota archaeon]